MNELVGQLMTPTVKATLTVFGIALLLIYLSSIVWVYRDAKLRDTSPLVWGLIAIIPLLGFILYLILRPPLYAADKREQDLEIARQERELYAGGYCKVCNYPIEPDYLLCPSCGVVLKKQCSSCGRALNLRWEVCPYCRTRQDDIQKKRADKIPAQSQRRTTTRRVQK